MLVTKGDTKKKTEYKIGFRKHRSLLIVGAPSVVTQRPRPQRVYNGSDLASFGSRCYATEATPPPSWRLGQPLRLQLIMTLRRCHSLPQYPVRTCLHITHNPPQVGPIHGYRRIQTLERIYSSTYRLETSEGTRVRHYCFSIHLEAAVGFAK